MSPNVRELFPHLPRSVGRHDPQHPLQHEVGNTKRRPGVQFVGNLGPFRRVGQPPHPLVNSEALSGAVVEPDGVRRFDDFQQESHTLAEHHHS